MSLAALSREAQLLLLSAGGSRNDAAIRRLLDEKLNWFKVSWLAETERASPVLWQRLNAVAGRPLPPDATQLERLAKVSEFRMLHLEQRLAQTLDALARAGIEGMLLKGAALALRTYGSFVQRPMSDIDLLLRPERAVDARRLLLTTGWGESAPSSDATWQEFYEGHHHLPPLEDERGTGVQLELHTALFFEGHPFLLPVEDVWHRGAPITIGRLTASVPSVHDQLLHMCLHFAWSHMMTSGVWRAFRDLEVLLGSGQVKWDDFVPLAIASRGATCCYWTFRLARQLIGTEIPDSVLAALRPPKSEFVLRRVERHFTYYILPTEMICPSVSLAYTMWQLAVLPGWSGHGGVRPWDRSDAILTPEANRPSGVRRLADQLSNLSVWANYVRSVLLMGVFSA